MARISHHLLLPLTKHKTAAEVGKWGRSDLRIIFLSSVDMKIYQCGGGGVTWDQILAPPLPSS